jgi:hypothetical protein
VDVVDAAAPGSLGAWPRGTAGPALGLVLLTVDWQERSIAARRCRCAAYSCHGHCRIGLFWQSPQPGPPVPQSRFFRPSGNAAAASLPVSTRCSAMHRLRPFGSEAMSFPSAPTRRFSWPLAVKPQAAGLRRASLRSLRVAQLCEWLLAGRESLKMARARSSSALNSAPMSTAMHHDAGEARCDQSRRLAGCCVLPPGKTFAMLRRMPVMSDPAARCRRRLPGRCLTGPAAAW